MNKLYRNIIIILLLILGLFGVLLTLELSKNNSSNTTIKYSSSSNLHIDMSNWSYDSKNKVYYQLGLVYTSKPVAKEYESMAIYVPADYMNCTIN